MVAVEAAEAAAGNAYCCISGFACMHSFCFCSTSIDRIITENVGSVPTTTSIEWYVGLCQAKALIGIAYKQKPNYYFKPGTGWHYSNTNYVLAGQVAKKVYTKISGQHKSLAQIIRDFWLKPLGLSHTYYLPGKYPKNIMDRLLHGYDGKHDMT